MKLKRKMSESDKHFKTRKLYYRFTSKLRLRAANLAVRSGTNTTSAVNTN